MAVTTQDQAQSPLGGSVLKSVSPQLLSWLVLGALAILCLVLREQYADLVKYPKELMLPIESWLEVGMDWFTLHFKPIFRFISSVLVVPMKGLEWLLHQMPWPFTMLVVAIVAYVAKGWKLSAFCLGALSCMLIVGYWDESMSTLALVGLSVPMSLLLGFTLGLMAFQFRGARRVIASGDSYNDTTMLEEADAGILFRAPANVIEEFPQYPAVETYEELRREFCAASERDLSV